MKRKDKNKTFGALIMNLSKGFDYLSLLIAKLHAISMELLSVKFLQDHLLNRQQRTKIDFKFII